jgi:hypothetical protein
MRCRKRADRESMLVETRLLISADLCKEKERKCSVYQAPQMFRVGEAKHLMAGYCHGNTNESDYSSYWS